MGHRGTKRALAGRCRAGENAGARLRTPSTADEGGEDVEETKESHPGLGGGRRGKFEFEEVEAREALDRGPARDRVVPRTLTRRGPSGALRDVERHGNRSTVELVGELRTTEGKPADDVAAEVESKAVRMPQGQASRSNRWREGTGVVNIGVSFRTRRPGLTFVASRRAGAGGEVRGEAFPKEKCEPSIGTEHP